MRNLCSSIHATRRPGRNRSEVAGGYWTISTKISPRFRKANPLSPTAPDRRSAPKCQFGAKSSAARVRECLGASGRCVAQCEPVARVKGES